MLQVIEIFASLQGESSYAGRPCVFIRLSGCNLRCNYCDTSYAFEGGEWLSVEQILSEVKKHNIPLVEVTGGEPLCQNESIQLMQALVDNGYQVLLETNGSLSIAEVPAGVVRIIDYKLKGSGEGGSFAEANYQLLREGDEVKFVISDRADYLEAKQWAEARGREGLNLLFSPVSERLKPELLASWILEDALAVRFQIQLHKVLGIS
ncbi:MAG: radical SAM protein [Candidatus Cloacimonadaceae bacterium]|jgi:7-carboxy-7-deazaguanine synthase